MPVLADGRATAVGSDLDGDERVDRGGGVLIPGLIDCHVHVAFPRPEPLPRSARFSTRCRSFAASSLAV
ncbi:hypothetical protein [Amycolatopsis sp.]|uniref:hypothetical protein n=1 Tax=Amycolatopsis sp. TaxID=37632 RepID=UPI002CF02E8F|nr:hypothetical protein [Amycolatopsis sp.]HVV13982.1 hypothetical protein [Amycolatopsis sp.]